MTNFENINGAYRATSATGQTEAFKSAMLDAGITPPDSVIGDGQLHRFHVEGDKSGSKNGAYVLHLDNHPAGWFLHFKTGQTGTWSLSGKRESLSPAMTRQIQDARRLRDQQAQATRQQAAQRAAYIWQHAAPAHSPEQHGHLARKRISPHGARL